MVKKELGSRMQFRLIVQPRCPSSKRGGETVEERRIAAREGVFSRGVHSHQGRKGRSRGKSAQEVQGECREDSEKRGRAFEVFWCALGESTKNAIKGARG